MDVEVWQAATGGWIALRRPREDRPGSKESRKTLEEEGWAFIGLTHLGLNVTLSPEQVGKIAGGGGTPTNLSGGGTSG